MDSVLRPHASPGLLGACARLARAWWLLSPAMNACAIALAAFALVLFPAMLVDDRTVLGLDPWIKPQKFAISLAVFLGTMSWILAMHRTPAWWRRIAISTFIAAAVTEIALISLQSLRGVRSHFNTETALDGTIYGIMGVAIIFSTLANLVTACLPLRSVPSGGGPVPMGSEVLHAGSRRASAVIGETAADSQGGDGAALSGGVRAGELLFLLGCAWGVFMAPRTGHSVGGNDGGAGLPYVNWSTQHGDLRVAHFVLLHALQAMPLAGWALDRWAGSLAPTARRAAVGALAGLVLLGSSWLAWRALDGQPLVRW